MPDYFADRLKTARRRKTEDVMAEFKEEEMSVIAGLAKWDRARADLLRHTSNEFVTELALPDAPPFDDGWTHHEDVSFPFKVDGVDFSLSHTLTKAGVEVWDLLFFAMQSERWPRGDGGKAAIGREWDEDDLWDLVADVIAFLDQRAQENN
jgi:hypothetical protein